MPPAVSAGRIARNTLMLYIRMLVMMAITLYTSRVVLRVLGVDDFGIYNLVGGIVVMFSFLNSAMASSTQRFLNYELGKGNEENVQKVLSTSIIIHILLVLLIAGLAETAGFWFLNSKLNIPPERMAAANWVYQFSILTFCANIVRVPYQAAIIAYERMTFYAYISVVEAALQLGVVYLLLVTGGDPLVLYAGLIFAVAAVVTFLSYLFCRFRFSTVRFRLVLEKRLLRQIAGFSGWTLFGSIATVGAQQGINILLNIFYGVGINAAVGIANQVSSAIYRFISNFGVAFHPQLIQLYAAGKKEELTALLFKSSKFSYFLFLVLSVPVFAYCEPVLKCWLGNVPEYSAGFCRLIILYLLLDAAASPLWISIQATGRVRTYQIGMSVLVLLNIPLAYLCLKAGMSPYSAWVIRVVLNVVAFAFRFVYLKQVMEFDPLDYVKKVVGIIGVVTLLAIPVPWLLASITRTTAGIVSGMVASMVVTAGIVYFVGLVKPEKVFIKMLAMKLLNR